MVNSIIDQLFDDNFEKEFLTQPSNKKLLKLLNASIEALQKTFSEEQLALFDNYMLNNFDYNLSETKSRLKLIFSKGVLLGIEIAKYN